MRHLDLTEEQAATLKDALTLYISDLRMEISHTDNRSVRDDLKGKEMILKDLLQTINTPEKPM